MNKLIFLTLAAIVGCALATPELHDEIDDIQDDPSELVLFETDEGETARLAGDKKIFSDFCLSSRDEVKLFLKSSLNNAASKVFNVMFNTVGEVTTDLGRVQQKAVAEGVELIKRSGIEEMVEDGHARSREEVEADIEANIKKVKRAGLWSTITEAVRTVINAVIETVSSETAKRLALLKEQFNGDNAREQIELACATISFQLKRDLNLQLAKTKSELLSTSQADTLKQVIETTRLEDVGCTTTSRINMVSRFCDVLLTVGPVFYPLVGL